MKVKFTNIEWDIEGELVDLPSEVILDLPEKVSPWYDGADLLSNEIGWTVLYFNYEVIE